MKGKIKKNDGCYIVTKKRYESIEYTKKNLITYDHCFKCGNTTDEGNLYEYKCKREGYGDIIHMHFCDWCNTHCRKVTQHLSLVCDDFR